MSSANMMISLTAYGTCKHWNGTHWNVRSKIRIAYRRAHIQTYRHTLSLSCSIPFSLTHWHGECERKINITTHTNTQIVIQFKNVLFKRSNINIMRRRPLFFCFFFLCFDDLFYSCLYDLSYPFWWCFLHLSIQVSLNKCTQWMNRFLSIIFIWGKAKKHRWYLTLTNCSLILPVYLLYHW